MKKELHFVYENFDQLVNINNGKDPNYSKIEIIKKDDKGEVVWLLLKQNSNDLLFFIQIVDYTPPYSKIVRRIGNSMWKLNKLNIIYFSQSESIRKVIDFLRIFILYPILFFTFWEMLYFERDSIIPYIHIEWVLNSNWGFGITTVLLLIFNILIFGFTSKLIDGTEEKIKLYES